MTSPILVTGGTGTLGQQLVARLQRAGRTVRVLARRAPGGESGAEFRSADLMTGEGVEPSVAGVEIVIHCAGTQKGDEVKARHLVRAASQAGVRHIVFISVVGADR